MSTHRKLRPFVGIDGEGAGRDPEGRQHYMLLRAGDQRLYTGKPLSTDECLDWLAALPEEPIYVGYAFGYDATQILRGLPIDCLTNERNMGLIDDKPAHRQGVTYTYYRNYGIEYVPNNHLRICRVRRKRRPDGTYGRITMPGSVRTIIDGYSNFRRPFIKALEQFGIGREHWPELQRMKAARAGFREITPEIDAYCKLECDLLAELMERFREQSHAQGLRPHSFNGAGKFSSYLHRKHKTMTSNEYKFRVPRECRAFATNAFYGGRFETTYVGTVEGPVYEYDQNSAYAWALQGLPCLEHGVWHRASGEQLGRLLGRRRRSPLFVCEASFRHPQGGLVCALPVRREDGRLVWPTHGKGVYWSDELRAARRFGAEITLGDGWQYQRACRCRHFKWIDPLYRQRRALGEQGEPLKIALAALYGKLAQRRYGIATYHNLLWAGLVTARVRAALLDAAAYDPQAIVMFGTDAVYSKRPLPVLIGEGLGEWRQEAVHQSLFIVQPGLYWVPGRTRSKGIPTSVFTAYTQDFEREWRNWFKLVAPSTNVLPAVRVPIRWFVGLRLATVTGHPENAGKWVLDDDGKGRLVSFAWGAKRGIGMMHGAEWITAPQDGGAASVSYSPELMETLDLRQMQLDEQQDAVDLTPP